MKNDKNKGVCATCKSEFDRAKVEKTLWPFCSKRCKVIDLGSWLSEKYAVETDETAELPKSEE